MLMLRRQRGMAVSGFSAAWGRRVLVVAALAGVTALSSACSGISISHAGGTGAPTGGQPASSSSSSRPSSSSTTKPSPTAVPATLRITPKDAATGVLPNAGVLATVSGGSITAAVLSDKSGRKIPLSVHKGSVKRTGGNLQLDTTYTLKIKATGTHGARSTTSSSFTTIQPAVTATYQVSPNSGTYGVGMPAGIIFDSAITIKAQRAAIQRAVSITTVPKQTGAWGWIGDRQLLWRPKSYWKAGTVVHVNAPIHGIQTGPSKYVGVDASASFRIGASHVSTVDIGRHHMSVDFGGERVADFKVSTGKPGRDTTTGTKVILSKQPSIIMDSATVGIPKGNPDYYYETVAWDMRVTWGGEFLHAAPWSVNSQGYVNVSHGCTNLSPVDAKWMYDHSIVGDVVQFVDGAAGHEMSPDDGIGVWLYSWNSWKSTSAT